MSVVTESFSDANIEAKCQTRFRSKTAKWFGSMLITLYTHSKVPSGAFPTHEAGRAQKNLWTGTWQGAKNSQSLGRHEQVPVASRASLPGTPF